MDMTDYIAWRGDLSFEASPFNDVDNLIFSELAYVDMDGIAPAALFSGITVKDVYSAYRLAKHDQSYLINDPYGALKSAAASKRFGDVKIGKYVNTIDPERQIQFSAVTFFPGDGTAFVAFRGTDNTLVGWREDFNMTYLAKTAGQDEAANYLSEVIAGCGMPVRVGGHSKGGNFAVYAAAFCKPELREKILRVYSNDGPGFNASLSSKPEYVSILDRITKIVPDNSIFGMLLTAKEKLTVVKSSEKGFQQHNPYTWEVLGASFVKAEMNSGLVEDTVKNWTDSLTPEQCRVFSEAVFGALESAGVDTLHELNSSKLTCYRAIARSLIKSDKTLYKGFTDVIKALAASGREVIRDEAKKKS